MDVAEIVNILSDFSKLEAELLIEETDFCAQKIGENLKNCLKEFLKIKIFTDEIRNEINLKRIILQALNDEISNLQPIVDKMSEQSENLDVEIVKKYKKINFFLMNEFFRFEQKRFRKSLRKTLKN